MPKRETSSRGKGTWITAKPSAKNESSICIARTGLFSLGSRVFFSLSLCLPYVLGASSKAKLWELSEGYFSELLSFFISAIIITIITILWEDQDEISQVSFMARQFSVKGLCCPRHKWYFQGRCILPYNQETLRGSSTSLFFGIKKRNRGKSRSVRVIP